MVYGIEVSGSWLASVLDAVKVEVLSITRGFVGEIGD